MENLFKSLVTKHFSRAYPGAKTSVIVRIEECRLHLIIHTDAKLSRSETSRILFPLFRRERFKDYEKHVSISCCYKDGVYPHGRVEQLIEEV